MTQTTNPTTLAAGRAGLAIKSFAAFDASSLTAAASFPQAATIIARKYHLEPVVARLVCHLAGIGKDA
jgi:hypothetical protein